MRGGGDDGGDTGNIIYVINLRLFNLFWKKESL